MWESVSTLTRSTKSSKPSTQRRTTGWEWDYQSVAPLSRVITAVYGQHGTMVLGPRFASLFHVDGRAGAWLLAAPFNAALPRESVQLQELNGFEAKREFAFSQSTKDKSR